MATVEQNQSTWGGAYDWSHGGDEWSAAWGGTPSLWHGVLLPRLKGSLPCDTILEIAPGYGRFTQYLHRLCKTLVVVDLAENCIAACKQRFATASNIDYFVNDGRSLDMIADASVDFVFCFDSLVHAEGDVLANYVSQLSRKLKIGGKGFIHHSNAGELVDIKTGCLPFPNLHWRAESMSASMFRDFCRSSQLVCDSQEIVNWGGPHLTDCLSCFSRTPFGDSSDPRLLINSRFMEQADFLRVLSEHYRDQTTSLNR
jgi:ubiquinone/menaquinone biosynthesis C-methylase UbiE